MQPRSVRTINFCPAPLDFGTRRHAKCQCNVAVANADKDSVTVKDVRKKLEDWLDMDLVEYKNSIRALVMDVM